MKDIKNYEGLYGITSCGRVWSYKSGRFLKPADNGQGYYGVSLYKNGKSKTYKIHKLVADAYLSNPEGKTCVNHKDENKHNNSINNLEWMTSAENIEYSNYQRIGKKKNTNGVFCIELNRSFKTQVEAAQILNINKQSIVNCLAGRQKTGGGYHWRYNN